MYTHESPAGDAERDRERTDRPGGDLPDSGQARHEEARDEEARHEEARDEEARHEEARSEPDEGAQLAERLQQEVTQARQELARKQRESEAAQAAASRRRTRGMVAILVLLVAFAAWQYARNGIAPDQSGRVADIAPTVNLHMEKELKWVATMDAGWEGLTDHALAQRTCVEMLAELAPYPDGLTHIVLKGPGGAEVATCQVDDTTAYLRKASTRYGPAQADVEQ